MMRKILYCQDRLRNFCHLWLISLVLGACSSPIPVSPVSENSADQNAQLKIIVSKQGMVQITSQDLKNHQIDPSHINLSRVNISLRGESQPVWVSGSGDSLKLVFYGEPANSVYTDNNVYILSTSSPTTTAMAELNAAPGGGQTASYFTYTIHYEENKVYSPLVEEGDHWFISSLPAGQSKSFPINLMDLVQGPAKLQFEVWSSTTAQVTPNHHLIIKLNSQIVVEDKWTGIGNRLLQGDIPPGILKEGENIVTVEAPGDTGAIVDTNYLDWFEIHYARSPEIKENSFGFYAAGEELQFNGLTSSVDVFDITTPAKVARLSGINAQNQQVSFHTQPGNHFWAVNQAGYAKPDALDLLTATPDIRHPDNNPEGADYIAIGPAALLEPLQPLLDLRKSEGLQVISVPLRAIYDQMNDGFPEPEAIQKYLSYASQSWVRKPKFVLLVGDATYDPKGYITQPAANQLPVFFVNTVYGGQTGTDVFYTITQNEQKPSIALGRLPAQNQDQITAYINKVLQYEHAAGQEAWLKAVLAVSDGQDVEFKDEATTFLSQLPAEYQSEAYNPPSGETGAGAVIQDKLNQGKALIAYFGHGSINMWGKDKLFTVDEAKSLKNTRLPVFVTMTCLNGYFIHPKVESLAEALLWVPGGGAVAVLAPTSLTVTSDQARFREPFMQALFTQKVSLGEALLIAEQKNIESTTELTEVQKTFLLFGDPALHLK